VNPAVDPFLNELKTRTEVVDESLRGAFEKFPWPRTTAIENLKKSMGYSLLQAGGKRFRPHLTLLTAEAFAVNPRKVLPWAVAIEMVHTYSLIHDDLPCMDNDDIRRGQATNHKVFGETTALLSGDALLTEAFHFIANSFEQESAVGLRLIRLLGEAAGVLGMVGGQMIDLAAQKDQAVVDELYLMHKMKTGALIRAAVEGSAAICGLPFEKVQLCRQFGEKLGLAFQIKDDLLDGVSDRFENHSFPGILGKDESKKILEQVSFEANEILSSLGLTKNLLNELVSYNLNREL